MPDYSKQEYPVRIAAAFYNVFRCRMKRLTRSDVSHYNETGGVFMKMEMIKNDILSLRGAKVSIFGQQAKLPAAVEPDVIDIIDIIDKLAPYEVTESYNIDEYLNQLDEIYCLTEIEHNNSYNWMGRVSNHFDYQLFSCGNGYYYVVFKVHRYGDVRANYTEEVLLQFSYENEFAEAIVECDKYIKNAHPHYDVLVSALHDMMEVYTIDGDYVCEISELDEIHEM